MELSEIGAGILSGASMCIIIVIVSTVLKVFVSPLKAVKVISVVVTMLIWLSVPLAIESIYENGWLVVTERSFANFLFMVTHLTVGFVSILLGLWLFNSKLSSNKSAHLDA